MRLSRFIPSMAAAIVVACMFGQAAHADLLIEVDKSTQRMVVILNGEQLYDWPVSTGAAGYGTPSGTFRPFRMEIDHHSDEYDNAPMPYSMFFTQTGVAVHGTYEQRNLGHAVSHGCVRLSVKNAATLWKLVKSEKMANTIVVLKGAVPNVRGPRMAVFRPMSAEVQIAIAAPVASIRSNGSAGYRAHYDGYYRGYRDGLYRAYNAGNYPNVGYYPGRDRPVDQGGCAFGSYSVCNGMICWRVCY